VLPENIISYTQVSMGLLDHNAVLVNGKLFNRGNFILFSIMAIAVLTPVGL
jgi:hypothetical protein